MAASGTLSLYWKLASDNGEERLSASAQLCDQLVSLLPAAGASESGERKRLDVDALIRQQQKEEDERQQAGGVAGGSLPSQARLFKESLTDGTGPAAVASSSRDPARNALQPDSRRAAALEKLLEKELPTEIAYAFKRLLRGLASPRQSSRIGFAVSLTQVSSTRSQTCIEGRRTIDASLSSLASSFLNRTL